MGHPNGLPKLEDPNQAPPPQVGHPNPSGFFQVSKLKVVHTICDTLSVATQLSLLKFHLE